MRSRLLTRALLVCLSMPLFAGCPDEVKETIAEERKDFGNEVGGAPKRTLDDAKMRVQRAAARDLARANAAADIAEE